MSHEAAPAVAIAAPRIGSPHPAFALPPRHAGPYGAGVPRSKEIIVLLVLLVGAMAFVLGYVIDRRAKNRAAPPVATRNLAPEPPRAESVDLTKTDGKTIDFSSGQAVIKDSPEDRAAIEAALKEMEEARKEVTFPPRPAPAPARPAATPPR